MVLFFVFIFLATVFLPGSVIVILIINMTVGMVFSISQIAVARFPRFAPPRRKIGAIKHPFVSIIIPSYNEPPALLMQTIQALTLLHYDRFEVLIIDNNTEDPAVWNPVEQFVRALDRRFKFFHVDQLPGYKAGALNYIMRHADARSEYIAVLDADYIVRPDFLETALAYFTDSDIALVQFPQEYRNVNAANQPIADEYWHFFRIYMNMANHLDCVPSTGTVSVYKSAVLWEIGGFNKEALTEDADAGLRIYGAGYRGVYVDHPVGRGLMPYDLEAYRKQKWRWAFGNAQSIGTLLSMFGKIPFRSWLGFLLHLTAWGHMNFLPFAVLGAYVIAMSPLTPPVTEMHKQLLNIVSLSIFFTLCSKWLLFITAFRHRRQSIWRSLRAFGVHMGMTFLYSEAFMALVFRSKSTFERTNKFVLPQAPSVIKNSYKELLFGLWFFIGAIEAIVLGRRAITIVAFFIAALMLFSIYYVYWKIFSTKAHSKKILVQLERMYKSFLPPLINT